MEIINDDVHDDIYLEQTEQHKILFNDTFGTRADYSKGLFYEIRRRYLREDNSLQPPEEFKLGRHFRANDVDGDVILRSRKATFIESPRPSVKSPRQTEKFYIQINNKSWEEKEAAAMLKAQYRRIEAAKKSKQPTRKVLLQKYSSTNPSDWREQCQAGCRLWVNRSTGEVSTICPWEDTYQSDCKGDTNDHEGTGALVYDSKDVDDLFSILESNLKK